MHDTVSALPGVTDSFPSVPLQSWSYSDAPKRSQVPVRDETRSSLNFVDYLNYYIYRAGFRPSSLKRQNAQGKWHISKKKLNLTFSLARRFDRRLVSRGCGNQVHCMQWDTRSSWQSHRQQRPGQWLFHWQIGQCRRLPVRVSIKSTLLWRRVLCRLVPARFPTI